MIKIDQERLFKGPRKWKIIMTFGFLLFFLLLSLILSIIIGIPSFSREPSYFEKYQQVIIFSAVTLPVTSIPMFLLFRYYSHLYNEPKNESSDLGYKPPTPSKCSLCGRHPISRKHHVRKIHGIDDGDVNEFYESCGCKFCVRPIEREFA